MSRHALPLRLTETGRRVLEYIIRYKTENDGNSPDFQEMMMGTGIRSTSIIGYQLGKLESLGLIVRKSDQSRSIQVEGGQWSMNGNGKEHP